MSASEGEADILVLRADVWKPEPDIERPAEAVISPLSFEGCTLFGFRTGHFAIDRSAPLWF